MLLVDRRINDAIEVGKDISVRILSVRGGRVRLGISAPRSVPINATSKSTSSTLPRPTLSSVLLVGAVQAERELARDGLARAGVEHIRAVGSVAEAHDAIEAYEEAGSLPQLVLSDLELGSADAVSIAHALRVRIGWEHVPLVVWSDHATAQQVRESYQAGARAFVRRPVDTDAMNCQLREMVRFWARCIALEEGSQDERISA